MFILTIVAKFLEPSEILTGFRFQEHHQKQFDVGGAEADGGYLGGGVSTVDLDFFPCHFHLVSSYRA